jgi:hypothetical protein
MKITKEQLKRIIKEEIENVLGEESADERATAALELQKSEEGKKLNQYARNNNSDRARKALRDINSLVTDSGPGASQTLSKMQSRDSYKGLDDVLVDLIINYASRAEEIRKVQGNVRGATNRAAGISSAQRRLLGKIKESVVAFLLKHKRTASIMKYPNGTALEQIYNELLADNPVKLFPKAPSPASNFDELVLQAAMKALMFDSFDNELEIKKGLRGVDQDAAERAAYAITQNTSKLLSKKRSFLQKTGSFFKGKGFREE